MKIILGLIFLCIGLVFLLPGILALFVGLIAGLVGLVVGVFGAIFAILASIFGAAVGIIAWLSKGLIIALLIVVGIYLLVSAGDRNGHVRSGRNNGQTTK
jgi:hypothetical protein